MKKISIGTSDFKQLRDEDLYYIDKSMLIKEMLEDSSRVVLLPRPRRFGKTLNMTMLRYFLEKPLEEHKDYFPDNSYLFKGLAIEQEEELMKYQGKYPVIYLTFKGVKSSDYTSAYKDVVMLVSEEYKRHNYLLENNFLDETAKKEYKEICEKRADENLYKNCLSNLTKHLERYHKEKVVVIIDEYDTPVHEAYVAGYYEEMIGFMRGFLGAGLKDNSSLKKGVLTGIMRIAKESIFSDINNLGVYTLLSHKMQDKFGFTEGEVSQILKDNNLLEKEQEVRDWYNGYLFGGEIIYNPWSILNYVDNVVDGFKPYWINTSSNDVIKKYLASSTQEVKEKLEVLVKGESIEEIVNENVVFKGIENSGELLWSFLLFSGYLKASYSHDQREKRIYKLSVPNREVKYIYEKVIMSWFEETLSNIKANQMLQALVSGDVRTFEVILNEFVIRMLSYHDTCSQEVERVYQAFVLGTMINLEGEYEVRSNRESGYGRSDTLIIPKDITKAGVVLEYKVIDKLYNESVEEALEAALKQIEEKKYEEEIKSRGVKEVYKIGIVFDGKRVWVKAGS